MVLGVPKNRLASGSVLQHSESIMMPSDATKEKQHGLYLLMQHSVMKLNSFHRA